MRCICKIFYTASFHYHCVTITQNREKNLIKIVHERQGGEEHLVWGIHYIPRHFDTPLGNWMIVSNHKACKAECFTNEWHQSRALLLDQVDHYASWYIVTFPFWHVPCISEKCPLMEKYALQKTVFLLIWIIHDFPVILLYACENQVKFGNSW